MRHVLGCLVLIATALALIAAPVPKEKAKVKDEDAIIGTWALEKADTGSVPFPEGLFKTQLNFAKDGTYVEIHDSKKSDGSEYKLDPSLKVKTIDIVNVAKQRTARFLYELDGDTLKLCLDGNNSQQRPAEMKPDSSDGKAIGVLTFKRVPEEKAPSDQKAERNNK